MTADEAVTGDPMGPLRDRIAAHLLRYPHVACWTDEEILEDCELSVTPEGTAGLLIAARAQAWRTWIAQGFPDGTLLAAAEQAARSRNPKERRRLLADCIEEHVQREWVLPSLRLIRAVFVDQRWWEDAPSALVCEAAGQLHPPRPPRACAAPTAVPQLFAALLATDGWTADTSGLPPCGATARTTVCGQDYPFAPTATEACNMLLALAARGDSYAGRRVQARDVEHARRFELASALLRHPAVAAQPLPAPATMWPRPLPQFACVNVKFVPVGSAAWQRCWRGAMSAVVDPVVVVADGLEGAPTRTGLLTAVVAVVGGTSAEIQRVLVPQLVARDIVYCGHWVAGARWPRPVGVDFTIVLDPELRQAAWAHLVAADEAHVPVLLDGDLSAAGLPRLLAAMDATLRELDPGAAEDSSGPVAAVTPAVEPDETPPGPLALLRRAVAEQAEGLLRAAPQWYADLGGLVLYVCGHVADGWRTAALASPAELRALIDDVDQARQRVSASWRTAARRGIGTALARQDTGNTHALRLALATGYVRTFGQQELFSPAASCVGAFVVAITGMHLGGESRVRLTQDAVRAQQAAPLRVSRSIARMPPVLRAALCAAARDLYALVTVTTVIRELRHVALLPGSVWTGAMVVSGPAVSRALRLIAAAGSTCNGVGLASAPGGYRLTFTPGIDAMALRAAVLAFEVAHAAAAPARHLPLGEPAVPGVGAGVVEEAPPSAPVEDAPVTPLAPPEPAVAPAPQPAPPPTRTVPAALLLTAAHEDAVVDFLRHHPAAARLDAAELQRRVGLPFDAVGEPAYGMWMGARQRAWRQWIADGPPPGLQLPTVPFEKRSRAALCVRDCVSATGGCLPTLDLLAAVFHAVHQETPARAWCLATLQLYPPFAPQIFPHTPSWLHAALPAGGAARTARAARHGIGMGAVRLLLLEMEHVFRPTWKEVDALLRALVARGDRYAGFRVARDADGAYRLVAAGDAPLPPQPLPLPLPWPDAGAPDDDGEGHDPAPAEPAARPVVSAPTVTTTTVEVIIPPADRARHAQMFTLYEACRAAAVDLPPAVSEYFSTGEPAAEGFRHVVTVPVRGGVASCSAGEHGVIVRVRE